MRSATVTRLVTTRPYAVNSQDSFQLSREYDLAAVILEYVGTLNRTAAATTVSALAPLQVFKVIEVKADGTRPFDQWDARLAGWGNFERALTSDLTPPGVGIATDNIRCSVRLDRITPDAYRPKDSALHTKDYMSLLECVWTMGQPTDLYAAAGAMTNANATLSGNVNLYVEELQEFDPADAHEWRMIKRCSRLEAIVNAVNSAQLVFLSVNALSAGVKLLQLDTTQGIGEPTAALLNNVTLRSGVDVRFKGSFAQLRQMNRANYRINDALFASRTGLAFVDLRHNGDLKTLYSTQGKNEWLLELDVNAGPGKILIEHIEYTVQPVHPAFANLVPQRKGGKGTSAKS